MARNPAFEAHLERMRALHEKKNEDYAEDTDPYSNFRLAATIADVPVDTVFRVLIGVKVARLNVLLAKLGSTQEGVSAPNFESIDDTVLDLSIYTALWASWRSGVDPSKNPVRRATANKALDEADAVVRTQPWVVTIPPNVGQTFTLHPDAAPRVPDYGEQ